MTYQQVCRLNQEIAYQRRARIARHRDGIVTALRVAFALDVPHRVARDPLCEPPGK